MKYIKMKKETFTTPLFIKKKSIITLACFLLGLISFTTSAQVISVAPGTDFSIGSGTLVSADSLDITPSANFILNGCSITKSNAVINSSNIPYIKKVYQFSNITNAFSGALKMFYNNADLNGITESSLKLLIHNGSSWSLDINSTVNTINKFVQNNSVSGVSLSEISAGACTPNTGDTTATACGSFVWYGVTYTASGTPMHTLTNVDGCDSVVTLLLTIIPPPGQPTSVNCWDNFVFNTNTCVWDNTGSQPTQTTQVNCWDNFVFNTNTCVWDNTGSQPTQPSVVNCWDNFVFNTATCVWDNTGSQPTQPSVVNCWDNFVFNTNTCVWDNTGSQPTQPTQVNCWDNFVYNTNTCVWDKTGSQPTQPSVVNCWDNFVFNTGTCVWDNTGSQPTQPSVVNCWDNFAFNTNTCVWDNTGSQPTQPTQVNCWDNFVFNTNTCVWDNTGSQPTQPTQVNCWDNFVFNTNTCVWDNTGSQPTEPELACYETANFNTNTCSWDITGTPPTPVVSTITNCNSYLWNAVTYTASGTYTYSNTTNAGCVVVDTLHLTIKKSTTSTTTVSNCGSYTWNAVTYPSSGTYTWTGINAAGCDSVATLNLTIQPITGVKTVTVACVTYTWSANSTAYTQSGTYYYTLDCRRDTLILTINANPTNVAITAANSVCRSSTGNLASANANGVGISYAWTITNGTITSGNGTAAIVYTAGASGSVSLGVTATSSAGCSTSATPKSVTTLAAPNAVITAASSVCPSATGVAASVASAGQSATYAWTITNGTITSGRTSRSMQFTAGTSGTVTISVRVTSSNGCFSIGNKSVTVASLATPVVTACGSTSLCPGGSVRLTSSAATSYLWSTGATTQSITVSTAGIYNVRVSNATGCFATSSNLTITVNSAATPTIAISSNASGAIASNTPVTFTASITGGGTSPVYQWKKNGTNVGTNSANYTNNSWLNGDVITCVLTSNYPCATTPSVTSNSISLSVSTVSAPKFLVVDVIQNRGFYYDSSFNFVSSNALSTGSLFGITNASDVNTNNGNVYVSDGVNRRIYRSNAPATVSAVSKTLRTQTGSNISSLKGLTINGDSLWVLDQFGKAIYRYSLSGAFSGSGYINAIAKINISNSKGESLCADNGNLYVLDNDRNRSLYRYTKSGSPCGRSKIMKTVSGLALGNGTGAVIDVDGRVWVTDQLNDKSYSYSLSSLFSGTGNLNASREFSLLNCSPTNANATGITLVNSTTMLKSPTNSAKFVDAQPEPETESFQYQIYPNPSASDYQLIVKSPNQSQKIKARILDVQGRLIKTMTFNSHETISFGNDLKAGIYLVEVSEGNIVKTIRVVKF